MADFFAPGGFAAFFAPGGFAAFLTMGGYAAYVWSAYAVTLLVLGVMMVASLRSRRRRREMLAALGAVRRSGRGEPE